jgi:iron complex outermembrane receptor protein
MKHLSRATVFMLLATTVSPLIAHAAPAENPVANLNAASAGGPQGPEKAAPTNSAASNAPSDGVAEIIVTAQRRGENLQNVPISITAIPANKLLASGVTTTADLALVTPGFQFQQSIGLAAPYIRGIGVAGQEAGLESSVATYIDGVYIAGGASALTTLNNVDRVEVLKGPQGTLFGRNASGGLIQIVTRDPKFAPAFEGGLTYDQWKTGTGSAYITGPLTSNIAADLAVRYSSQGEGWGRNLQTGEQVNKLNHDFAVRSKWLFDLNDQSKLRIAGDYSDTLGSTFVTFSPVPGHAGSGNYLFTGNPWDSVSSFRDPLRHSINWGVSADYTNNLGFATLRSITAYRGSYFHASFDPGALPTPTVTIFSRIMEQQYSQELQLLSEDSSRLKWIVGAYYFRGDSGGSGGRNLLYPLLTFAPGLLTVTQDYGNVTSSVAAYAQATYPLTDRLNLTGGIRLTHDDFVYRNPSTITDLTFVPAPYNISTANFPDRRGQTTKPSWRLALDYKLAPTTLVYASYNRGFKSGGYDIEVENGPLLKPEEVDSFEVGTKIDAFDRKMRFNATVFYEDVKNLQLVLLYNGASNIRNAASVHAYGAEAELTLAPVSGLTLTASGSYLHSTYFRFFGNAPVTTPLPGGGNNVNPSGNDTGNQTPRQPEKTLTLSANYEHPFAGGKLGFNGSWFWSDKWYSDPDDRLYQPAYSQVGVEASWTDPSGHFRYRIFGHNLANAAVTAQFGELSNGDVRSLTEPRTIGGGIDFKF